MIVFSFFRAVAEGVVSQGLGGLVQEVPGGRYFAQVAEFALVRYRQLRREAEARDEMREMVAAEFASVRQQAKAVADEVAPPGTPVEDRISLELFLTQIPPAVRKTLARPEDPSGLTVPAAFALRTPDDVLKVLPPGPPRLRPGMSLPGRAGWVVDSLIGTGGFGEVWFARHTRMTALTGAVKVCPARRAADLLHEGDLINRVMAAGEHPNVVRLLDADLDGDPPWLLFEHVAGGDLSGWVHELQGKPPAKRVKQVVAALGQLASAVGHFHRLNPAVVHRDLKPSNILVSGDRSRETGVRKTVGSGASLTPDSRLLTPVLRITDFGIGAVSSRDALEAERQGTATRGGRLQSYLRGSHTPLYASPQQREGADPDPRDDVHALGVIAYQMLTGDMNRGAGADLPDDLREAGVPEPLVELIAKCVAQKPDRRPRDGADLAARLAEIKLDRPAAAPEPAPLPKQKRSAVAAPLSLDDAEPVDPVPTPSRRRSPPPPEPAPRQPSARVWIAPLFILAFIAVAAVGFFLLTSAGDSKPPSTERKGNYPATKEWPTPDPPKPGGGGYKY